MLKKIRDLTRRERCLHPEHNPPMHMVYPHGVYEHTCPSCKSKQVFVIDGPTW